MKNRRSVQTSRSKLGVANRRAGHSYERSLAKVFRDIGYVDCKTSRFASRELDGWGIDLCNIPFNVQAKNVRSAIKYPDLIRSIEDNVKGTHREKYPALIFHKRGRKQHEHLVTMTEFEFIRLLKIIIRLFNYIPTLNENLQDNRSGVA